MAGERSVLKAAVAVSATLVWAVVAVAKGAAVTSSQKANPLGFPEYVQILEADFANESEARAAMVSLADLPDGARYAFGCRWDDNREANLAKAEMMAEIGVRGTFFLFGGDKYLRESAPQLLKLGHAIGNHTLSHAARMHEISAEAAFEQILRAKIDIETATGWTVTSFAMPWGWRTPDDPERKPLLAKMLLDTGHFVSAQGRVKDNGAGPDVFYPSLVFSANDAVPDAKLFREKFGKLVQDAVRHPLDAPIVFGVHADSDERGTWVQKRCLQSVLPESGVFLADANTWGAYRYSRLNGSAAITERCGNVVSVSIRRFAPSSLGSDVPLSVVFSPTPQTVRCASARVLKGKAKGEWKVEHDRTRGLPQSVRRIHGDAGSSCGVAASLSVDESRGVADYSVSTTDGSVLTDVSLVFYAPPMWLRGRHSCQRRRLDATERIEGSFALGRRSARSDYAVGRRFYAMAVDYVQNGVPRRLYVENETGAEHADTDKEG